MATRRTSWEVAGDPALFAALRAEWERAADARERSRGAREVDGTRVFAKASRLAPAAGRRHALRRTVLGVPVPRLAEFGNLRWLREHGFRAPEPLVAAVRWTGATTGLPHRPDFQALVTRLVEDARPLDRTLAHGVPPAWHLDRLGRQVARLHAAGFVHRDLFARNLLVDADGHWTFLDAWRGGPRPGGRGPLWDVACFLEEDLPQEVRAAFLDAYRSAGGVAPGPALARERARVRRRYARG